MSNAELFSPVSREYAKFRPRYPPELFSWLAGRAPAREAVWDCGCGSGQASLALAGYFNRVHATDVAAEQIAAARTHPRVEYSVAPAESSGLAAGSVDLVTVAQALHWFDVERFYAEVRRVTRPGGLLLVTAYGWSSATPAFDAVLKRMVLAPIKPLWPPQNQLIMDGYRDVPFPFERVPFPQVSIAVRWTLRQYLDYIATWTAVRRMVDSDPGFLARIDAPLRDAWAGEGEKTVTMELLVICGRVS